MQHLKFPVKYDGMTYFFDGAGHMIGDFNGGKLMNLFRVRGWGWISNLFGRKLDMRAPEVIQDEIAIFIQDAINEKLLSVDLLRGLKNALNEQYGEGSEKALVIVENHDGGVTQRPALEEIFKLLKM